MAIKLSTTKEYNSLLKECLTTYKKLEAVSGDVLSEGSYVPYFKVANIQWAEADSDIVARINSSCNSNTVFSNGYGWFAFILSLLGCIVLGLVLIETWYSRDVAGMLVCGLFLYGTLLILVASLNGVTNVVKKQLQQAIICGNYKIADITPIAAYKSVNHGHHCSWDSVQILFSVDNYIFEDADTKYLHGIHADLGDCENKLGYDTYKLLKFEVHTLFKRPYTHYAICGLMD